MKLHAAAAFLPEGWRRDVAIDVGADGRIASVAAGASPGGRERLEGFVVPGMPNLHSHAFQRAMAGLTEARTREDDSFWTWRETMYRFAGRITPEGMEDVATWCYVEMLKAGYTSVGEFHYIHHDVGGRPFVDPAEISLRIFSAARTAGIALTHLPVLYTHGGFGEKPAAPAQSRFLNDARSFARLLEACRARAKGHPDVRVGCAFHSLRAVDAGMMHDVLAALEGADPKAPIHIHVAEQVREVEECVAWSGERPVRWLLGHMPVDARWCLVHATHMDASEMRDVAARGAVAGLCPTTEANLGDGIFPGIAFGAAGGRFGIGSDSHVTLDAAGELRLLEYGQRLASNRRAAMATASEPSPGTVMYRAAASGGARALGVEAGRIAAGARADLVVLSRDHRAFWNQPLEGVLDAWIFAGDASCVRDVMVGGAWRIREGRHGDEDSLAARFRAAQARLLA